MLHIHQIGSEGASYTVIQTDDPVNHPALVDYPELFELIDTELPKEIQYLSYEISVDPIVDLQTQIDALATDVELLKNPL